MDRVDIKVDKVKTDIMELKTDIMELKTDIAELKTDVAEIKIKIKLLKNCDGWLPYRYGFRSYVGGRIKVVPLVYLSRRYIAAFIAPYLSLFNI